MQVRLHDSPENENSIMLAILLDMKWSKFPDLFI